MTFQRLVDRGIPVHRHTTDTAAATRRRAFFSAFASPVPSPGSPLGVEGGRSPSARRCAATLRRGGLPGQSAPERRRGLTPGVAGRRDRQVRGSLGGPLPPVGRRPPRAGLPATRQVAGYRTSGWLTCALGAASP